MKTALPANAQQQAFTEARTFNAFTTQAVGDDTLRQLYDLYKWGPTAFNMQPARVVFVRSDESKAKLAAALMEGNRAKTLAAPVTAIVAMDTQFFEHLPEQFKAMDAKPLFANNPTMAQAAAFRNSTLQGAYLMIAARMLGLDCGAMSGFNPAAVDEAFFADGRFKSNFLVNIGYGDASGNYPRGPRLSFEQAVSVV